MSENQEALHLGSQQRGDNSDGALVWRDGRAPAVLCSARRKNGTPCKRPPVAGATVCRAHGGAAPQVKRKAQERLLEGVPKMLRMLKQLASDETVPPAVRLAAIRDWLDRAGIDRKIEIDISSTSFEEMLVGAIAHVEDDRVIGNPLNYRDREVLEGELVDDELGHDEGGEEIAPHQALASSVVPLQPSPTARR